MKKSTQAALLSALVFPGLGQFLLKKKGLGLLFSGVAVVSLYILLSHAVERAQQIAEKIQTGEIPVDIQAITDSVMAQSASMDSSGVGIATGMLVTVWVLSIVHSFFVDSKEGSAS